MATSDSTPPPPLDRYSKENRWYLKSIDGNLPSTSRKLLEEYSHIPPEEVDSHVYKMRDILWSQNPYPCIGQFKFLKLHLHSHPLYPRILSTLSQSPSAAFLDLGCCVAQELRSLTHAGIPSSQLYGSDLLPSFLDTSHDLFNDRSTFAATLIPADIFSPTLFSPTSPFSGLEGKFSIIHAGLFLHLFNRDQQLHICSTIVKLLQTAKGSMFVGEMAGCEGGDERAEGPGAKFGKKGEERRQWLCDEGSFKKMWEEVEGRTGTEGCWKVESKFWKMEKALHAAEGSSFFTREGVGWLVFWVERVKDGGDGL